MLGWFSGRGPCGFRRSEIERKDRPRLEGVMARTVAKVPLAAGVNGDGASTAARFEVPVKG